MDKPCSYKKLDELLKMFAPKYEEQSSSYSYKDIQNIIKTTDGFSINPNEIEILLEQLINDKYVTLDTVRMYQMRLPYASDEVMYHYYKITNPGLNLLNDGGYYKIERRRKYSKIWKGIQNAVIITTAILAVIVSINQCHISKQTIELQRQVDTLKIK